MNATVPSPSSRPATRFRPARATRAVAGLVDTVGVVGVVMGDQGEEQRSPARRTQLGRPYGVDPVIVGTAARWPTAMTRGSRPYWASGTGRRRRGGPGWSWTRPRSTSTGRA